MRSLLVILLVSSPSAALAGELHARDYEATVEAVSAVKSFELSDPFVELESEPRATPVSIRVGRSACRLRLRVESDYAPLGARPIDVFASRDACARIKPGLRTRVQYFGLANMFRLVAIEIDGVWRALPLMRLTTSALVTTCLAAREKLCEDVRLDAPL